MRARQIKTLTDSQIDLVTSVPEDRRKLKKWFDGGVAGKTMCWSGDSTTLNLTTYTGAIEFASDGTDNSKDGFYPRLRDTTVYARGVNGASFATFLADGLASGYNLSDIVALDCDLYVLCWGINDCRTTSSYTAATLQANLQTAIDTIKASVPRACIILRMPNFHQTGSASITGSATAENCMQRYHAAYRAMRDYHDDVLVWEGLYPNEPLAAGVSHRLLNADGLHPSSSGYYLTIRSILNLCDPAENYRDTDWQREGSIASPLSYDETNSKVIWHPDVDPQVLAGPDYYKAYAIVSSTDGGTHYNIGFKNFTAVTAGKPVPGRHAFGAEACTFTNGSADIALASATQSLPTGTVVEFRNSAGGLPTNFAENTKYYVVSSSGANIQVSATAGGAAISAGSAGTGTQYVGIYGAIAPGCVSGDIVSWNLKRNRLNTYIINDVPFSLQTPSTGVLRWTSNATHPSDRPRALTFSNGSATITWAGHDLENGEKLSLVNSGGGLPTNFAASTIYYVVNSSTDAGTFELSATSGGASITAGSAGTGTQYAVRPSGETYTGYIYRHRYAFCEELRAAVDMMADAPTFEGAVDSNVNPYAVLRRFYVTSGGDGTITIRALEEGNGNITDTSVYNYDTNKANVYLFLAGVSGGSDTNTYGINLASATLTYDTSADTITIALAGIDFSKYIIPQGYLTSPA